MKTVDKIWQSIRTRGFAGQCVVLVFGFLSLIVMLSDKAPKTLRIALLLALMLAYAIMYWPRREHPTFNKIQYWIIVGSLSLVFLMYVAVSVNEPLIALSLLGGLTFFLLLVNTVGYWMSLHRTSELARVVVSYVSLSVIWILVFGVAYAWFGLEWSNPATSDKAVAGNLVLYFSGLVYYSNTVGDIVPIGNAKWIVLAESAWSVVFHGIIVARVIDSLRAKRT